MAGGGINDWGGDDDDKPRGPAGKRLKDWDCPSCNANNPTDEFVPEKKGIEMRCNYCGAEYRVTLTDEGRLKFKEL
jgi:transcription elongation factor Elf1